MVWSLAPLESWEARSQGPWNFITTKKVQSRMNNNSFRSHSMIAKYVTEGRTIPSKSMRPRREDYDALDSTGNFRLVRW